MENRKQGIEEMESLVAQKLAEIVGCISKDDQPEINHTNMETANGLCAMLKFLDMYKRDDDGLDSHIAKIIRG